MSVLSVRFHNFPIQRKITLIIIIGMASAMLVTVTNFIIFDRENVRIDLNEEMQVLARITSVRSAAALAFGDKFSALENLSALSLRRSVQHACIYDHQQQLFVNYHRKTSPFNSCPASLSVMPINHTQLNGHLMVVIEPIIKKGNHLGYVLIASDLSPMARRTKRWIYTSVLVTIVALIVAFLMTRRMQNAVVNPIVHLASVMDRVKQSNDLSLRATSNSKDEVGNLVASFNNMVRILQLRNRDLELLYQELVEKSAEAESTAASMEVSNQLIKDLFSGAAHDLRQPLQAMCIFADTLSRKIDEPEQLDLLNKLKQAMANLSDLFTEVLDTSRYNFDLYIAGTQPTSVKELLSRVFLEFEVMAQQKNLKLKFFTSDHIVLAHGALLERIIRNLLSNAIRYTDVGGVLLGCRRRGNSLVIEVWDTGRGIPESRREDIFSKYVQVQENNSAESGGFGLGLAIVKQFVDQLGYELTLHSKVAKGTVFKLRVPLYLPRHQLEVSAPPEQQLNATDPAHLGANLTSDHLVKLSSQEAEIVTRILLIDDNATVRHAIREALVSWGFVVDDFENIGAMEDFYRNGGAAPRLIISDYQLQGDVTGDQAILAARAVIGAEISAFIITGAVAEAALANIEAAGLLAVPKPIRPARLRAMVNHFLS